MLRRSTDEYTDRRPQQRWSRLLARQQAAIIGSPAVEEDGFVTDIGADAEANTDFRRVLFTGKNIQLVLMSVAPGEELGKETHSLTQFIRVEAGTGVALLDGAERELSEGSAVVVPEGISHNIINTGEVDLKLYTIYSPPNHPAGTVHKTKEDADAAEAGE